MIYLVRVQCVCQCSSIVTNCLICWDHQLHIWQYSVSTHDSEVCSCISFDQLSGHIKCLISRHTSISDYSCICSSQHHCRSCCISHIYIFSWDICCIWSYQVCIELDCGVVSTICTSQIIDIKLSIWSYK